MLHSSLHAQVVINEISAVNDTNWLDEDLEYSDWIELKNTSAVSVDLTGWYLTDDVDDLTKWQFPSITMPADSYLVIFASNKNRSASGAELHTNFKLAGSGEYLALVQADGTQIEYEFTPAYPPQATDITYGISGEGSLSSITFIDATAACSARVPVDSSDDLGWHLIDFKESASWINGHTGVGYDENTTYRSLINLDVKAQMNEVNGSVYIRIPFTVSDATRVKSLSLRMKYDDGFVAYLNGVKVASANAPSTLSWNSTATALHNDADAQVFVTYDISTFISLLTDGENVLAIHGLNDSLTSSDMLIVPELDGTVATETSDGELGFLVRPTPGTANSATYNTLSEPVFISKSDGVYSSPFTVEVSATNDVDAIYYTLDGTEPTATSAMYSGPIPISSTTMLRARSFKAGYSLGAISSETYVFLSNDVKSFTSDLPIIVLDNLGISSTIPDTGEALPVKQRAFMGFFEPAANGRTSLTNQFTIGTRAGMIRRGKSTIRNTATKPNLSIETWGEGIDDDADIKPFGMPAESDWILWAPFRYDPAGIRNPLAHLLYGLTGNYAVRTHFVEVFLNVSGGNVSMDDYVGLYVFMEKIKIENDRIDIDEVGPLDTMEPNVSGGYILQIDADEGEYGSNPLSGISQPSIFCSEPDLFSIVPEQQSYIENYVATFESLIHQNNPAYTNYFDIQKAVDHHLLNMLTMNPDAFRLSTFLYKPRNGKLSYGPVWDFDRAMESVDYRDDNPLIWNAPSGGTKYFDYEPEAIWWNDLFKYPDFWQAYIDRWQELREGVFSESNIVSIVDSLAAEVAEAKARDIARWTGVNSPRGVYSVPRTGSNGLDGTQQGEINHLKWWLSQRLNWIDSRFLAKPILSQASSPIADTISLTMTASSGHMIYYTTDGSDPRAAGGLPSASASVYSGPLTVPADTIIKARVWNGTAWGSGSVAPYDAPWSGLTEGVYQRLSQKLLLTEIHYNPAAPPAGSAYLNDDFEFVEFRNIGLAPLDLRGYALAGGIAFSFEGSAVESLPAGGFVVVVRNLAAFSSRYDTTGIPIAGEYAQSLGNNGDHLRLEFNGEKLFDISYTDARGWPPGADGGGHSLIPLNESVGAKQFDTLDYYGNWRASSYIGGSPGRADPAPPAGVLINEIIAHTDTGSAPPYDSNDQVELYNPLNSDIVLDKYWYLSDSLSDLEKWNIPTDTIIPAKGWVVFDENDFHPDRLDGFGLDKAGEQIILSHLPGTGDDRIVDAIVFKGQANGASWGRYPDGASYIQTLSPTPDAANQPGPDGVKISGIMYNPVSQPGINTDETLEYVSLKNDSNAAITFNELPDLPNPWRIAGGIEFSFPSDFSLASHADVFLVPFDPDVHPALKVAFCAEYSLNTEAVQLLGPYTGDLSDNGERIRLERPQASDDPESPEDISWIIVDEAVWLDQLPWPREADGSGYALIRAGRNGTDPLSWTTALDADNDRLMDSWEVLYFGSTNAIHGGADDDWDQDGASNYCEQLAGTDPTVASSTFRIIAMDFADHIELSWQSVIGKRYSIGISTNLADGFYTTESIVLPTPPFNTIILPNTRSQQVFYRIDADNE
ncbi:MAG: CotH kinase family protein [Pontiellaceae bacterium]|nr:CotH kinase family protein [Pontiellaceae bacterium]MBN2783695.1 CotH kinase family protein [Pontiellaceae bacterium]